MSNMTVNGVKCPVCGEPLYVRASGYGGSPGYSGYDHYNGAGHPGDPPEISDVDEVLFEECDHDVAFLVDGKRAEDDSAKKFWDEVDRQIFENGEVEMDEYEPYDPEYP